MAGLDLEKIANEVEEDHGWEYRDPLDSPWGDPEKNTETQEEVWEFVQEKTGSGPIISVIGAKGAAKAEPLDEPVLTPEGWTKMGNLSVGDRVVGSDGKPTTVVGVYPQGKRPLCTVTFSDGSEVRCSPDHLWAVQTGSMKSRDRGFRVLSTQELANDLNTRQGWNKWYLPNVDPVEFGEKDLPIPPYTLGALIGDGSITHKTPVLHSQDEEIAVRCSEELEVDLNRRQNGSFSFSRHERTAEGYGKVNPFTSILKDLRLHGKKSYDKFIPEQYQYGSVEQRKALLRGLMDTDGTICHKRGTGEFCTVSEQLAEDVCELVRSLGGVTKVKDYENDTGCGYYFTINVNLPFNPFWLPRKAEKINTEATQGRAKSIESIEYGGMEEMQCIAVDNSDALYVTTDYTVTHNTHLGACFAAHQGQMYPGSIGVLIAHSYQQVTDVGRDVFSKVMNNCGFKVGFFNNKKVNDEKYSNVYCVDMDGEGYDKGRSFFVLARSFDATQNLEGTEPDWMWVEEVQDADKDNFIQAISRVRGPKADNALMICGMPEDEYHWQYSLIPKLIESNEDEEGEKGNGVFREVSLMENLHNVGEKYLTRLKTMYDRQMAQRYIHGEASSITGDKVLYQMRPNVHQKGRMSEICCEYEPYTDLIISFDFNTSPMCVTLWQLKPWSDDWAAEEIRIREDGSVAVYEDVRAAEEEVKGKVQAEFESLSAYSEASREVLAQVDEYEVWDGGTRETCSQIVADYQEHMGGMTIIGDATGNRKDTRSSTTDWKIIREAFRELPNVTVIPGLIQNSNIKTGEVKYSNPDRRDTINALNAALMDAEGRPHICFLPYSQYDSGGAARSCEKMKKKPDGRIDDTVDRQEGRDVPRTHFFDTVRYANWWFRGDAFAMNTEQFEEETAALANQTEGGSEQFDWGAEQFGSDWDGVF